MPGWLTDLVRNAVLRTNPYWPFRRCNRIPYHVAIRSVVRSIRRQPGIRSLYLRHGLAEGEWTPALSDIDFTLILKRGFPAEAEFGFLKDFWTRYGHLRRAFPMLGEVEILAEDELAPWLSLSSCVPGGRHWTLLHGEHSEDLSADGSPHWRRRALSFALWIYLEILPPCAMRPDSFLRRQDIQRRAGKILRLLQPILAEAGQPYMPVDPVSGTASLITDLIFALRTAAGYVVSQQTGDDPPAPTDLHRVPASDREPPPLPFAGAEGVRSVVPKPDGTALLVLEDNLGREAVRRLLETTLRGCSGLACTPVFVHHSLFAYVVRHENPFFFSDLLRRPTPDSGCDPLEGIDPPSRTALRANTVDRIANVLTFTRSAELHSRARPLAPSALRTSLNRALAARLLFGGGEIHPDAGENAARGFSEFPEAAGALEEIEAQIRAGSEEPARQTAFSLFRSLAGSISEQVSQPDAGGVLAGVAESRGGGA